MHATSTDCCPASRLDVGAAVGIAVGDETSDTVVGIAVGDENSDTVGALDESKIRKVGSAVGI